MGNSSVAIDMTKRNLDPATLAKLGDLTNQFELCDPMGKRLGYFIPATPPEQYAGVDSSLSEGELQRREAEDRRHTTAEVLDYLRKL